ncbi:hypothetical protein OSTOST_03007 [Ostertagia ostertagi]
MKSYLSLLLLLLAFVQVTLAYEGNEYFRFYKECLESFNQVGNDLGYGMGKAKCTNRSVVSATISTIDAVGEEEPGLA